MGVWIQITSGSSEPIYSQIVAQINEAVARGDLAAGDKLPAVRKLAQELVINPNTVARAYTLLEQQGLVSSKIGSGTFVTDPKLRDKDAGKLNLLAERIDNVLSQGLNLGLSADELRELFDLRLKNFITRR
jgi:GntR family transcriptional regulator